METLISPTLVLGGLLAVSAAATVFLSRDRSTHTTHTTHTKHSKTLSNSSKKTRTKSKRSKSKQVNEFGLDAPKTPEELVAQNKEWEQTRKRLGMTVRRTSKKSNNYNFNEGSEENQFKLKFRRSTRKRSTRQ